VHTHKVIQSSLRFDDKRESRGLLREYEGERARRDEREISFRERETLSPTPAQRCLSLYCTVPQREERDFSLSLSEISLSLSLTPKRDVSLSLIPL